MLRICREIGWTSLVVRVVQLMGSLVYTLQENSP